MRDSPNTTPAVRIEAFHKQYGDVDAVSGIDLTVAAGEVFGIVGPNGAGKSTTLRTIATLITPDSGRIEVFGTDVGTAPEQAREIIRYLPEEAGAYDNLTGRGYLEFVADIYADASEPIVQRGIEIAELGDRLNDKTAEYSKGMTRKLLLASTLMTRPDLAILDEPTSGLDVRNAQSVRETIAAFPDGERSVLLSSHDMFEVTALCDRIALLDGGEIVAVGDPDDLVAEYGADNLEQAFLEATE